MIDSEQVPRGKGEKQAGEADEIEPETICLQGSGALRSNASSNFKAQMSNDFDIWILSFGFALFRSVTLCLLKNEPTSLCESLSKLYGAEAERKQV